MQYWRQKKKFHIYVKTTEATINYLSVSFHYTLRNIWWQQLSNLSLYQAYIDSQEKKKSDSIELCSRRRKSNRYNTKWWDYCLTRPFHLMSAKWPITSGNLIRRVHGIFLQCSVVSKISVVLKYVYTKEYLSCQRPMLCMNGSKEIPNGKCPCWTYKVVEIFPML